MRNKRVNLYHATRIPNVTSCPVYKADGLEELSSKDGTLTSTNGHEMMIAFVGKGENIRVFRIVPCPKNKSVRSLDNNLMENFLPQ